MNEHGASARIHRTKKAPHWILSGECGVCIVLSKPSRRTKFLTALFNFDLDRSFLRWPQARTSMHRHNACYEATGRNIRTGQVGVAQLYGTARDVFEMNFHRKRFCATTASKTTWRGKSPRGRWVTWPGRKARARWNISQNFPNNRGSRSGVSYVRRAATNARCDVTKPSDSNRTMVGGATF